MSLVHQVGSDLERAYARSDLPDVRRVLMQRWLQFVSDASGEVVVLNISTAHEQGSVGNKSGTATLCLTCPAPNKIKEVGEFPETVFPDASKTILGRPYPEFSRPNLHDTVIEFLAELKNVRRSAKDPFSLYKYIMEQGGFSAEKSRGLYWDFLLQALQRNKAATTPQTAHELMMQNVRSIDY